MEGAGWEGGGVLGTRAASRRPHCMGSLPALMFWQGGLTPGPTPRALESCYGEGEAASVAGTAPSGAPGLCLQGCAVLPLHLSLCSLVTFSKLSQN